MIKLILLVLGNILALYAAVTLVPGFNLAGSWQELLTAGLALAILNMVVRPILKTISFPIILLTLGFFSLVINALMLWILAFLMPAVSFDNLYALIGATIIVSVVNVFVSIFRKLV